MKTLEAIVAAFWFLFLSACDKPAQTKEPASPPTSPSHAPPPALITGTTTNQGGNPLVNATVQIQNTQFKTTTNDRGEYSLQYIPGRFVIRAHAADHLSKEVPLDIAQQTTFPAAPIRLIPMPERQGWVDYIKNDISNQDVYFVTGKKYRFSDVAQLLNLSIDPFEQAGEREVTTLATAKYKAVNAILTSNFRATSVPLDTTERRLEKDGIWEQSFPVRLRFKAPNTWTWIRE